MDIPTSQLIETIAKLKHKPVLLSGYARRGDAGDGETVLLHPRLDPGYYYVIEQDCIVHVLPTAGDEHGHVTLVLDANCEIECVSRQRVVAADLHCDRPKHGCDCVPLDSFDMIAKDKARDALIELARALVAIGVTEFDCGRWVLSGGIAGCCQAWNRLLDVVKGGGNAFDAANAVLASCSARG